MSVEHLLSHFVRVTDIDDSPDLTDIHPRDRKDMDLNFVPIDDTLFPQTASLIKTFPKIRNAYIIALGPQSQLYPHVDTIKLEPYAEIDWLSVYMGIFVPSQDSSKVAVKVGNTVYNHKDTIIFDTQIPHSAWNWTDEWWVSIRLAVCKSAFQ
jgi:aspartyl/asparaginyl beta-hydroxylase (cupin superfamily)